MMQLSNPSSYDTGIAQIPFVNNTTFFFVKEYSVKNEVERKKREIQEILYRDVLNDTNPVVIYKKGMPFFWNPAMEEITGYTFTEIQTLQEQGADIMELLYSWSREELERVRRSVVEGHEKKEWYDERVFTLRTKQWELVTIAWHTEFYGNTSVRRGSIETARKKQAIADSASAMRSVIKDLMRHTDVYTSGHIVRVTQGSVVLAKLYGYDEKRVEELDIMAWVHDMGKQQIDKEVLRKPSGLTEAERRSMYNHAGSGVLYWVTNKWGMYVRGMPHHSHFFSNRWDKSLIFEDLIECMKNGEEVDLGLFNNLMGGNIPEEARIISIADTIDAIVSRRTYSSLLGANIEEIIGYLEKELLDATWLKMDGEKIILDETKWMVIHPEDKDCVSVSWEDGLMYAPKSNEVKIQFDPRIIIKLYETGGSLHADIKDLIRRNDSELIPGKITEIEICLAWFIEDEILEHEQENYNRLKSALEKLRAYIG